MKYIIGIDPSLSNTGVAVIKKTVNSIVIEEAYNIETKKTDGDINKRILKIVRQVMNPLLKYKDKNTTIIIENPAYFKLNMNTFKKLNMLLGGLLVESDLITDNIETVSPSTWQSYLKVNKKDNKRIKRKEIKEEAYKLVSDIVSIDSLPKLKKEENIIDAICIALYNYLKGEE